MKYLSLFSGIGGFELGIQQAYEDLQNGESPGGLRQKKSLSIGRVPDSSSKSDERQYPTCIGYSEIDKYAIQVYNKHFKHKNYGDITKTIATSLPDFDLLVGGFPCQSFSIAGKRGGFSDTRGTLFFEIARIVREKQPRILLLENVKGLLSHDKGKTFITIISTLDELGYDCQWQVLNSKNFGVPQNRERVFIVGHLRGTSSPEVFPIGGTTKSVTYNNTVRTGGRGSLTKKHAWDLVMPVITPDRLNKRQNGRRMKEAGEPAFTCTAQDIHGIYDGAKIRRLTPKECERLQGFPDDWTRYGFDNDWGYDEIGGKGPVKEFTNISDSQRYKMCGNAVTVNVIKEIMLKLIR